MFRFLSFIALTLSLSAFAGEYRDCVDNMNLRTGLNLSQCEQFCEEYDSNKDLQFCVISMGRDTKLTSIQALAYCTEVNPHYYMVTCFTNLAKNTGLEYDDIHQTCGYINKNKVAQQCAIDQSLKGLKKFEDLLKKCQPKK